MKLRFLFFLTTLFIIYVTPCFGVSLPPASSKLTMVVTSQALATQVGNKILQQGGNAIDAAVAVGYALAVVKPCCGNLGGGGFMLIHLHNGKNTFINFREQAPQAANPSIYLTKEGKLIPNLTTKGYLAVAIPGTVAGLNYALQHYGSMPLKTVIKPAIELAEKGYQLQAGDIDLLKQKTADFKTQANVAKIFLHEGRPYQAGEKLIQTDLAQTLTEIAEKGSDAFYKGEIADEIVNASKTNNGILSKTDFTNYKVEELKPIECEYRGYKIITSPPPSGGGVTLCEMVSILQKYPLSFLGYHSAMTTHYNVEAMRYAFLDRNQYLGDPNFVNNPIDTLLSPKHIKLLQRKISKYVAGHTKISKQMLNVAKEGKDTTHYSIIDQKGNVVAVTYTINGYFGAKIIAGNTGFFLNNEIDDFTINPGRPNQFQLVQGKANLLAPNKKPLSSMTPTIILSNNQFFMTLGAAGGSTIPTQILQIVENIIDFNMNLQEAVDASRYHAQALPDVIFIEPFTFSKDTVERLQNMGYHFQKGSPFHTSTWGVADAIERNIKSGILWGANDSRNPEGLAQGLSKPYT